MADVIKPAKQPESAQNPYIAQTTDTDPTETAEWLESLEYVINSKGGDRHFPFENIIHRISFVRSDQ